MVLLFQCRKCGKFFYRSKHYTASVSNIYCVKIITPCNINRQRILMIPCFIFYRNSKYACKDISYSHFNLVLLKVKFLSYFVKTQRFCHHKIQQKCHHDFSFLTFSIIMLYEGGFYIVQKRSY